MAIATQLTNENHDVIVVENSRGVIRQHEDTLDIMFYYGNGATLGVLRDIEVGNADLLIAVTPRDELNMVCCTIAKKLGCRGTIARVRNPEYLEQLHFMREELGLTMTVNPEWASAREIFGLLQYPAFLQRDSFPGARVEIVELDVREDSPWVGHSLSELGRRIKQRMLVCAVMRDGEVCIPDGNYILLAGDKVTVTAATPHLPEVVRMMGLKSRSARDVMIVGGSPIAQYLAQILLRSNTRVKIIERNQERCRQLAEKLPGATIICNDGADQTVLREERMEQMDAVVTLTDMDEENLLISMYAKYLGVGQIITKINRTEYNDVFRAHGVAESIISPKNLCAQMIVSYVRAVQNTGGSAVKSIHYLLDGGAEAFEFEVTASTRNLNIPLSQLKLRQSTLIASVNHLGRTIIPGGADVLCEGDTVIIISTPDRIIMDLNDIFADSDEVWSESSVV